MKHRFVTLAWSLIPAFGLLASEPPAAVGAGLLHELRSDADVGELGVEESYQEAVALEKEIAQLYREIRAARLSRIQRQSLKTSLRQTLLPISGRMTPDGGILGSKARSREDITSYQQELKKLMQENDAIVANAEELLQSLLPEKPEAVEEEGEVELEQLLAEMKEMESLSPESAAGESPQEQAERLEQQAEQAHREARESLESALEEMELASKALEESSLTDKQEDGSSEPESPAAGEQEAMDQLAEAMALLEGGIESLGEDQGTLEERAAQAAQAAGQISEALERTIEADGTLQRRGESQAQPHTEKSIDYLEQAESRFQASMQAAQLAVKLKALADAAGPSSDQEILQQQALGELARAEAGTYLDLTRQMKGQNLGIAPEPVAAGQRPSSPQTNFTGIPGRKVVREGGTSAEWFHVNKWYILGPYDNAGRMNLQKVYPPQSFVDLDANYIGKHGVKLGWDYDSFVDAMVNPSTGRGDYTIYYGFTELYFEEAADLWIAVGSDDRSDLWINDMPVWHSSNKLKIWNIGEGFRKVHFKQGRNKLVFRLENGWQNLGFSLLINTGG